MVWNVYFNFSLNYCLGSFDTMNLFTFQSCTCKYIKPLAMFYIESYMKMTSPVGLERKKSTLFYQILVPFVKLISLNLYVITYT